MPTRRLQEETGQQRPAGLSWGKQSSAVAGQEGVWVGPETHVNVSSKNLTPICWPPLPQGDIPGAHFR